jgi:hypothetical protein
MAITTPYATLFLDVCSETTPKTLEEIRGEVLAKHHVTMTVPQSVEIANNLEGSHITSNYRVDKNNTTQGRRTIRTVRKCSSGKTLTF